MAVALGITTRYVQGQPKTKATTAAADYDLSVPTAAKLPKVDSREPPQITP